jgi:hypothetical protein
MAKPLRRVTRNQTVRLPADLITRVRRKALAESRSLNEVVQVLLEGWVGASSSDPIGEMIRAGEEIAARDRPRKPVAWDLRREELYER